MLNLTVDRKAITETKFCLYTYCLYKTRTTASSTTVNKHLAHRNEAQLYEKDLSWEHKEL